MIFIHYIYLVSKYYSDDLIRAKRTYAETLISFDIQVPYQIIIKLIMLVNGSATFYIQNVLLYYITNACKWTEYAGKNVRKSFIFTPSELNGRPLVCI